jgi:hypothetical protein
MTSKESNGLEVVEDTCLDIGTLCFYDNRAYSIHWEEGIGLACRKQEWSWRDSRDKCVQVTNLQKTRDIWIFNFV